MVADAEGLAGGGEDLALEAEGGKGAAIRATKEPTAGGQHVQGEGCESPEIVFNTENFAVFIAGKRRWVEDDCVECAALFGKATQPVECVAFAKMMGVGIECVVGEIAFGPGEVRL